MRGKNEIKGIQREAKTGRDGVREMGDKREREGEVLRSEVWARFTIPMLFWIVREKDGKRDGWAIIAFFVVCARFMNPMLLFGSGQQIEGKTSSRDEE